MNDLQQLLDEYLATRRALGAELRLCGRLLQRFVAFAAQRESAFLTTALAQQWATQPRDAQPAQWANRFGMVRRFALYAHAADLRHEVPPPGLLRGSFRRSQPYLYTDEEIADLLGAARGLSGTTGLRSCTYATLLALLAVTGMRPTEPLGLDRDDVDLETGVLTVRQGKFGKSRHIPVHASTQQALAGYAAQRDRLCIQPLSPGFFLSERGTRITEWALRRKFVKLSRQVGLRGPSDSRGPRPPGLAASVRRRDAAELVSQRRRCRTPLAAPGHLPRACPRERHVLVSHRHSGTAGGGRPTARPPRVEAAAMKAADFPPLLAAFFTQRLMQQRQASPHTITSYRDTFRLLVRYAQRELHKPPTSLALDDLGPDFLGAFLTHLETERGNDARTRNTRLAAIRSFFGYVAAYEPQHAALAQRVLAMPSKRYTRRPVDFLNRAEVDALLQAPDVRTRAGRRDRTLLLVAVQTGLRASELLNLRREDVQLGPGAHLRCQGKGRKERCTPLRRDSVAALRQWLDELSDEPGSPVFPNQRGGSLSHDGAGLRPGQAFGHCPDRLPLVAEKTCHAPRAASHRSHGPAAKRCRPRRDRIVAGSRVRRNYLHLSARRSQAEGAGDGPDDTIGDPSKPIPSQRQGLGVSQQLVIIPSLRLQPPRFRPP